MKLRINSKLWNKLERFQNDPSQKPKIFECIDANDNASGENTFTNSVEDFFSRMQERITSMFDSYFDEEWETITSLSDIEKSSETGGEYIAQLLSDDETIISDIIIAYGTKAGNTLISQQVNTFILQRIKEYNNINYLYDKGVKKILYFTYDLNKREYASSIQEVIKSLASLEFNIVEMFPSTGNDFSNFRTAQEAFDFYKLHQRGTTVSMTQDNGKIVLNKNTPSGIGSGFYMFGILLLAYYKLSHPELGFDRIEFHFGNDTSNVKFTDYLENIYTGKFYEGRSLKKLDFNLYKSKEDDENTFGSNTLVYGAPGTGKSHYINTHIKPKFDGMVERVTLYEDFDYTDFVGGLKPTNDENNQINYTFVPGIFTKILAHAFNYPTEQHLLIIEELNRANASSVFGDIFQLLDRSEFGISEYEIHNDYLTKFLDLEVQGLTSFHKDGVKIPGNLTIFATMNPADQGVQEIDSAFKRRWNMKYLPISFDNSIGETVVKGFNELTWQQVGEGINSCLINLGVEEDSRLGQYFLKQRELEDVYSVSSKLLGYLWNDAVPYQRDQIFKSTTLAETITFFEDLNRPRNSIFTDEVIKAIGL